MMTDVDPLLSPAAVATTLPFNTGRLDQLLEAAGIDVLLVTSKHNIRYLLSGYSFFFFDQFDAIGITRYLPILIYPKGRPHQAVYIGNLMEDSEAENGRFWCPTVETRASGTLDAVDLAIKHIRRLDMAGGTIGLEASFFPGDALDALRSGLPGTRTTDGHFSLERLRAVKTADELLLIREASERVVEAMMVTFASCRPGMTKRDLMNRLRQEEIERGLNVDYCLMTAGSGLNRAPSDQVIQNGAGKSTLIKILAGVYAADGGKILFRGQPVRRVADLPIVFIHQDLGLVDWMTITENVALTRGFDRRFGLISWRRCEETAHRALRQLGVDLDPETRVRSLSRTEQSLVAIARAITTSARILVMDEPTASLPADEVTRRHDAVRTMRAQGIAVIYVSHRSEEIFAIADRVVVLRDGRVVGDRPIMETDPRDLVRLIVGGAVKEVTRDPRPDRPPWRGTGDDRASDVWSHAVSRGSRPAG